MDVHKIRVFFVHEMDFFFAIATRPAPGTSEYLITEVTDK